MRKSCHNWMRLNLEFWRIFKCRKTIQMQIIIETKLLNAYTLTQTHTCSKTFNHFLGLNNVEKEEIHLKCQITGILSPNTLVLSRFAKIRFVIQRSTAAPGVTGKCLWILISVISCEPTKFVFFCIFCRIEDESLPKIRILLQNKGESYFSLLAAILFGWWSLTKERNGWLWSWNEFEQVTYVVKFEFEFKW